MRLGPPPEVEEEPGQFWKDFIRETAPVFRRPTIEQLREFIAPTFEALLDGARYVDERLAEIIAEVQPDVIVEDNVLTFPAILASGQAVGARRVLQPGRDQGPQHRRRRSPATRRTTAAHWDAYWAEYAAAHAELHASFSAFCVERGAPALPAGEFMHESDWLNLYLYPEAVDYAARAAARATTWHNLQTSVRATDEAWEVPAELRDGPGKLVYLSLGSLGSARRRAVPGVDRRDGGLGPPRDRLQGPAARADQVARQHGRRGVPAADVGAAARRPRHHPRRQQHGHRVPVLRQAHGLAPAVLGPVRQRPADPRDRLRRAAGHLRPHAGGAARRGRRAAGRRRRWPRGWPRSRASCRPRRARCARRT